MKTIFPTALAVLGLLQFLPVSLHAENEVGFIERFALAPDREKVLGELVPGSEDFYFYHALHYQNTRNKPKLTELLKQWQKRFPDDTEKRQIIENREALLTYDADPQATLDYLKRQLNLEFNHEQQVRDKKPDLPTTLDPNRIDRSVFLADSLRNNNNLGGLSAQALEALLRDRTPLSGEQRRALLGKLRRPDVPGLLDLIATDLRSRESGGFGEFPIHRALLPEQLDQLLKAVPDLAGNERFVFARVRKLVPGAEVDLEYDTAERLAWLDRVWAYVKTLPASFNTLKAQVLYQRLDHDRRGGVYDRARFIEYLQLPRSFDYVNPKLIDKAARAQAPVASLDADLSQALIEPPRIGNDEPLVREYFLHLFAEQADTSAEAAIKPFSAYVRDTWLKPVFAEAMITSGQGDPERWASLLAPSEFQRLKDRVDIEFPATNPQFFASSDAAQFDVIVKNTPKLLVKIYEINTLNFYLTQKRQLNTDLNLDGLVANSEQVRTFESGPFKREHFQFKLTDFKFTTPASKRGAWVVEFIGGGRSSRVLVRAGQWQVLQQTGPAGDLLLVVDEQGEPVKDAVAWLDGRKYTRDEKLGRIVIPYTNQPGTKSVVLADPAGTFASLNFIEHHGEDYRLNATFHIEREQLLSGRQATLVMRCDLMLGEAHLAPALLTEPRLLITSITRDGIATSREVKDLKLSAGSDLTHVLTVPDRLASLTVNFFAKVDVLTNGGEKLELNGSHTWQVNGIDSTPAVLQAHLLDFSGQRVFELLGKNGEPVPDQPIVFGFKHREFDRVKTVPLRTDEKGRVQLASLADIVHVTARLPDARQFGWPLEDSLRTVSSVIHTREGEPVLVPVAYVPTEPCEAEVSLLEIKAGTFTASHNSGLKWIDGFVKAEGLTAGDYSLHFRRTNQDVAIKVTAGKPMGGWYLGANRNLEAKGMKPLQITGTSIDKDMITLRLANVTPFTRVHVAATRFEAGRGIFGELAGFSRIGAASGVPAKLPVLYSAGREIGDEYRYILERRYAKAYPGNMLTRPGLLLNPWEVRATDLEELSQRAGEGAGATAGGSAGKLGRAKAEAAPEKPRVPGEAGNVNLDFLADSAPVIYNLLPDEKGEVRFERKALGDRQQVQVYAEDLENAVWRKFSLPDAGIKYADQRLARNLDPVKPFTQKKEITVLAAGKTLTLADILTSELETYDTLSGVHALFTTLSHEPNLAKFAWVLNWPKLKEEEKRAKYSEFACHELNFFLARKDKAFFDAVIKPNMVNKKDPTFMDHFLLGHDLKGYLEPWAYGRLNVVERCLLAQRIEGEAPNAARHLRELWELLPPDPEGDDMRFETALRGQAMEQSGGAFRDAYRAESTAAAAPAPASPPQLPQEVMPAPAAAPADPFAAPGGGTSSLRRSMTASEAENLPKVLASPVPLEAKKAKQMAMDRDQALNGDITADGLAKPASPVALNVEGFEFGYIPTQTALAGRAAARAYFRQLGPTKEWAEDNYYQVRISEQNESLVPVSPFWRDYAAWIAEGSKGAFVSGNVTHAWHNFTEMMLALAVLDLPFDAPKHVTKAGGGQFTFTAAGPVIAYHKEIKAAAPADPKQGQLLVSQSFYRNSDRFEEKGNEKFEKYVSGEFLTGEVYGANVVVTNPTSGRAKAEVLMQIPQGALPVQNSKATDSRQVRLEPYTTQTFEYHFYFPATPAKAGAKFPHFPVNVAAAGATAGSAKPFEFNVVARFTQVDKASWEYVSQEGSEAEVIDYLNRNNIDRLDLDKIAWRYRLGVDFYRKVVALLNTRHVWHDTTARYSLIHNDTATLREWLKHQPGFIDTCGPLQSTLITIDRTERHDYEHLEYSPLVNQRAHRVGNEWRIANPAVLEQYQALLGNLVLKPRLTDADSMSVVYYLFLQDRVEEALARFTSINAAALTTKLQYDYFRCYAAFYDGTLADARTIAASHSNEPVVRWKTLFADVLSQLDEIEGKQVKSEKGDKPDREKETSGLAATEPALDLKVENRSITLNWKNLGEVTLNYYLMDPEFSFSSSPFVSQDASRFSIIRPNRSAVQKLPAGKDSIEVPLPAEFAKANVLVEAVAAGMRKTQAYHANTLKLTVTENYGRLETLDSSSGKPVSKAYVKVYARLKNGALRFFKDGYTDLRGRFDYASLNGPEALFPATEPSPPSTPANGLDYQMLKPVELNSVDRLAVLVLSETNGAMVKEVAPPQQ